MVCLLAILFNIGEIFFQDEWVAKIVSRFSDQDATKENEAIDPDVVNKECKEDNDV